MSPTTSSTTPSKWTAHGISCSPFKPLHSLLTISLILSQETTLDHPERHSTWHSIQNIRLASKTVWYFQPDIRSIAGLDIEFKMWLTNSTLLASATSSLRTHMSPSYYGVSTCFCRFLDTGAPEHSQPTSPSSLRTSSSKYRIRSFRSAPATNRK